MKSTSNNSQISEDTAQEEIARRAYELWEQEGRVHGNDQKHWQDAEQQLHGSQLARDSNPSAIAEKQMLSTEAARSDKSTKKKRS